MGIPPPGSAGGSQVLSGPSGEAQSSAQSERSGLFAATAWTVLTGVLIALFALWVMGWSLFGHLPNSWLVPGPATSVVGDEGWLALIKVALTIAAGVGGAVALVVAYRKQKLAERQEPRIAAEERRAVASAELDRERAYLDQYWGAVAQLGHANATVRLAGVYALANLADAWPTRRQQCLDVLCAHLRTPWNPPGQDEPVLGVVQLQEVSENGTVTRTYPDHSGEVEVRTTILRVIGAHLLKDVDRPVGYASWSGLPLDFQGALLPALDWRNCEVPAADFTGATFGGNAMFMGSVFGGKMVFSEVNFRGRVVFTGVAFEQYVTFSLARFGGQVSFEGAHFGAGVTFRNAAFDGYARFAKAKFKRWTTFADSVFDGPASFVDSVFDAVYCGSTTFNRNARFDRAVFGDASFMAAAFNRSCSFRGAIFDRSVTFADVAFNGDVNFLHTTFNGPAEFDRSKFHGYRATVLPTLESRSFHENDSVGGLSFHGAELAHPPTFRVVQNPEAGVLPYVELPDDTLSVERSGMLPTIDPVVDWWDEPASGPEFDFSFDERLRAALTEATIGSASKTPADGKRSDLQRGSG